jgi:hypothetical protein
MIVWWVFLGACVVVYGLYHAVVYGPEEKARAQAQAQWDRQHFNGWRLEKSYDDEHGILFDKLDKKKCTAKGYPGYDPCPSQQYFVDGTPQEPPAEPTPTAKKSGKRH